MLLGVYFGVFTMSYTEKLNSNLIEMAKAGQFEIIAHGCNCFNCMGAGIAKSIRENFPEAFQVDQKTHHGSYNKLGTLSIAKSENGVYIANLYTQFTPGKSADISAIDICLNKLQYIASTWGLQEIGLPLIGCGIGGLNWKDVRPLVKKYLGKFNTTVVILGDKLP